MVRSGMRRATVTGKSDPLIDALRTGTTHLPDFVRSRPLISPGPIRPILLCASQSNRRPESVDKIRALPGKTAVRLRGPAEMSVGRRACVNRSAERQLLTNSAGA